MMADDPNSNPSGGPVREVAGVVRGDQIQEAAEVRLYDRTDTLIDTRGYRVAKTDNLGWPAQVHWESRTFNYDPMLTQKNNLPSYREF